jgi:formiminotetrahydrofolate cyclodeaminase
VWHQRRAGKKLSITVEAFRRLTAAYKRALEEQAARLGEIQEARADLTLGPVTVGPHA